MKYRWGFVEGGVFTECKPVVEDDTSLDFSQQSGEVFYRAKLNGSLLFRFAEFDSILSKGYNYEHIVVLQYYDENAADWAECWRGRFALTDCEIDYDTQTISVQPETQDRYTKILDHLEDEYNLLKLAPQQQPVDILIRPCLQVYALNSDKISNCIGNNTWEASCDAVGNADIANYHFTKKIDRIAFMVHYNSHWSYGEQTVIYIGEPEYDYDVVIDGIHRAFYVNGKYYDTYYNEWRTHTLLAGLTQYSDESRFGLVLGVNSEMITFSFDRDESGTACAVDLLSSTVVDDANADWQKIYGRIILQTDAAQWLGYTLYDLGTTDMAGANLNYNKIADFAAIQTVFSADTQTEPTEWGQAYTDKYFIKPTIGGRYWNPVGQGLWRYMSWWYVDELPQTAYDSVTAQRTIKDCYKLPSIITRLIQKGGLNPQYFISRVLGGNNDYVGEPFYLLLTPRSNIISSYYDTPAQNAPITLTKALSMLKQAYKIYWHIDANGNVHVEHISYYENGMSYTEDEPDLLIDLESHIHTNTKENKCFGQNKIKYEKADMPELFAFGWDDAQTKPFDGWQIICKDAYVSKGQKDEKIIGGYDSDVDFVLSSPNDVSKDGFFLLACPQEGGSIVWRLNIQAFTITDENGEKYNISIQNADAAFYKIHKSFWRYDLPCENLNINNEDATAITTGKYKLQSVEFADTVLAEILADVDNCNKIIRTQQGDGKIKTLSINLNSLAAKADLLFNFVGRWYYLKGLALGNSITINLNGEPITIQVSANNFIYKYAEPITALAFNGADVVSVNFADCDKLENITSCNDMFKNCAELLSVDFGGKKLAAVTSATDMFTGCTQLTTLVCPQTSTWKPDISFADCPDLTTESVYSLIGFLYDYDSGVHTINFNSTMWNAVDADTQNDIIAKAGAKGWTIGTAVAYYISGTSAANTVYATINGTAVEIPVSGGTFNYAYYAPITSLSFENDTDLATIDFSLSDGLAGVTSLADAFKGCSGLTAVDFTGCDLTNLVSASDAFAGCVSLYELIIPAGTWKPDVDLSATAIAYAEMSNVVSGLYTYTSGTHTITFNSTIWDALSVAQQQTIFDAAQLKWWTTNAVAVVYYIRGTSSNVNGQETFNIQFIDDGALSPSAAETITCAVDANGDWEYNYMHKKIYSLNSFAASNLTCLTFDFSAADDLTQLNDITSAFFDCSNATVYATQTLDNVKYAGENSQSIYGAFQGVGGVNLPNATFASLIKGEKLFRGCKSASISLPEATFNSLLTQEVSPQGGMFSDLANCTSISLPKATFASLITCRNMFADSNNLTSVSMPNATFKETLSIERMFANCTLLQGITISKATFEKVTSAKGMFFMCSNLLQFIEPTTLNFAELTNVGDAISGGYIGMFQGCFALQKVDMHTQTFPKLQYSRMMFAGCYSLQEVDFSAAICDKLAYTVRMFDAFDGSSHPSVLTTISVSQNSTAILPTSSASNAPMNLQYLPLNYTSMLKVANWLCDLTGYTAHTCTFKASAWNALSSAEQNTIDSILSGKNWNRAIA